MNAWKTSAVAALHGLKHKAHTTDGGVRRGWPVHEPWRRGTGDSFAFPDFAHQTPCTSAPPTFNRSLQPSRARNEHTFALLRHRPYCAPPQKNGDQGALTGEIGSQIAYKTRHGQDVISPGSRLTAADAVTPATPLRTATSRGLSWVRDTFFCRPLNFQHVAAFLSPIGN